MINLLNNLKYGKIISIGDDNVDKIIMLGTGAGSSIKFYNACFALQKGGEFMLIDGGGGINILEQLDKAFIPIESIKNIFVTHNHIDHIIGIIWVIRKLALMMIFNNYEEEINIYASEVTIDAIRTISKLILNSKQSAYLDYKIHLNVVEDREKINILGDVFTFYDVYATKEKQFGFRIDTVDNKSIVCNGDESLNEKNYDLVKNVDYLIHEAFCLDSQKEIKKPYEKGHKTAKDVCEIAESLSVKNLILYHISDEDTVNRKNKYIKENTNYFSGNLYVPDDLEIIDIK